MVECQMSGPGSPREHWASRLGFVLAAAGSAIGLANVWRFPYLAGAYGGGAFLIAYIVFVATLGLSILLAELVIGRAAQCNPVAAFRALRGEPWPMLGLLGIFAAFLILSFYTVVSGWTLAYAVKMSLGHLTAEGAPITEVFDAFTAHPVEPLVSSGVFMAMTVAVVISGVNRGIERANLFLMPLLLVLLAVLVVRALTLPGAVSGFLAFLRPDLTKMTTEMLTAALGQAFFSLSLGAGAMITYGSYLSRGRGLLGEASAVVTLDTLTAFLAALVVLPSVFAFGLDPQSGPSLAFITLPTVFARMPLGLLFGTLFFVLLAIAALASAISMLEPIVAYFVESHGFLRRQVAFAVGLYAYLLGVPSSLSMGARSDYILFGSPFLGFVDFAASNVLLPTGGLLIALFVGWFWGPPAIDEAFPRTRRARLIGWIWLLLLRLPAPAAIAWILASSFLD